MNYRMQCSCGLAFYRGGSTKEEAVEKFRALMTQDTFDEHISTYHGTGEQKPTLAQFHASIPQMVTTAEEGLKLTYPALTKPA